MTTMTISPSDHLRSKNIFDMLASGEQLAELERAFPLVEPGIRPFGERVLIQLRTPKIKTDGGILLVQESQEIEEWNNQIGVIRAIGPLAFHSRDSRTLWPEGAWARVGDFVRTIKYGGDRWDMKIPGRPDEKALFVVVKDLDLTGAVEGDPIAMTAINKNL